MNPQEYEEVAGDYFRQRGYAIQPTSYTNDWGVDCFASRDGERVAVQAKMYGGGMRSVNRKMVMELCGAMHYFDCNRAALVTDGQLRPDAFMVATKLGIEIIQLPAVEGESNQASQKGIYIDPVRPALPERPPQPMAQTDEHFSFDSIWSQYVMPLMGRTLVNRRGTANQILKVDWTGVRRITRTGNEGTIPIEIFRFAINELQNHGRLSRKRINDEYQGRASSGVCLILSQVPFIDYDTTASPPSLIWHDL